MNLFKLVRIKSVDLTTSNTKPISYSTTTFCEVCKNEVEEDTEYDEETKKFTCEKCRKKKEENERL